MGEERRVRDPTQCGGTRSWGSGVSGGRGWSLVGKNCLGVRGSRSEDPLQWTETRSRDDTREVERKDSREEVRTDERRSDFRIKKLFDN